MNYLKMNNVAVILAAGDGTRMKSKKSKLLLEINGMTVIERTVRAFACVPLIDEIIVVCREADLESFEAVLNNYDISYCFGGKTRQESVSNAVEVIDDCNLIIIHDGARPLVSRQEIEETIDVALKKDAAAVGVAVKDTIKIIGKGLKIVSTPDRGTLVAIRTPQIFNFELYRQALETANNNNLDFTDDCALVENIGKDVYVVPGSFDNIKITTPEDIAVAESILRTKGEA
ncbi:MAG: 2-C-methyl-D-erythritol 4-phosphate cytidylyltransferase [Eubacterium sp.]|nr:2-C-methyl-D-erythritol 4-phosphate cytidylyltransferase [Eubacterium sp.]